MDDATAIRIIEADIASLRARIVRRHVWARVEVGELLDLAASACGAKDPIAAREIVTRAEERFGRALQVGNRLLYVAGMLGGVLLLGSLGGALVLSSSSVSVGLAPGPVLLSIFAFAGLGSIVSCLTRIRSLDLREETSRWVVALSAAARPVIAMGFASVVYLILQYQLVSIQVGGGSDGAQHALWFVASFLCGYSERFGSDLLGRLPFASEPAPQAAVTTPVEVSPTV
jgi:hypothetical protein